MFTIHLRKGTSASIICGQCPIESSGGHNTSALSIFVHHPRVNLRH